MKVAKTKEVKVIQCRYIPAAYGWEDCAEYDRSEYNRIKKELAEYRLAGGAGMVYRVITRRVANN